MHIPIDPSKEYSPMEIYSNGFILNTIGKSDYRYILRLITLGQLRAKNYCKGKKGKIFKVLGSDIIEWKKKTAATFYVPQVKKNYPYTGRHLKPYPQDDSKDSVD